MKKIQLPKPEDKVFEITSKGYSLCLKRVSSKYFALTGIKKDGKWLEFDQERFEHIFFDYFTGIGFVEEAFFFFIAYENLWAIKDGETYPSGCLRETTELEVECGNYKLKTTYEELRLKRLCPYSLSFAEHVWDGMELPDDEFLMFPFCYPDRKFVTIKTSQLEPIE